MRWRVTSSWLIASRSPAAAGSSFRGMKNANCERRAIRRAKRLGWLLSSIRCHRVSARRRAPPRPPPPVIPTLCTLLSCAAWRSPDANACRCSSRCCVEVSSWPCASASSSSPPDSGVWPSRLGVNRPGRRRLPHRRGATSGTGRTMPSPTGGSPRRTTMRSGPGARCPAWPLTAPTGSSSPSGAIGIDRVTSGRTAPTIWWSSTATATSSSAGSSGTRS